MNAVLWDKRSQGPQDDESRKNKRDDGENESRDERNHVDSLDTRLRNDSPSSSKSRNR